MRKKKNDKKKKKNNSKSPKMKEDKKDIPKEIGIFNDFLIFDKNDKNKDNNIEFQNFKNDNPFLNDWLILQNNPKKTESRFSNLFKEIKERDNKNIEKNVITDNNINNNDNIKNNKDNNDNNINNINNNLIINNDINNNVINDKININDKKNNNINNNNNDLNIDNNKNLNNDINENININDSISINTINFFKENTNNNNFNNFNNNNINLRNNSEQLPTSGFISNPYYNNNYFKEGNIPELSFSYTNQIGNFPFIGNNLYEPKQSIFSNSSGTINYSSTNDSDFFSFSNRSSYFDGRPSEKKFDLNVDIKKVICLEDRRTTVMIKNIPNKFNRDTILNMIDQHFKTAYDVFILPTDVNGYKNFGYSFINFTSSYYIPNFYFLFNGKKWPNTNSQKTCEITYSKIQGKNNLLLHYSNKIIFHNEDAKKFNISQKYIIPNEYRMIFNNAFPNQFVEENKYYFITKIPFRY